MSTKEIVTQEKNKPSLNEQTFGKLVEAAYVLQEHNREMQKLEESLELHSERLRQQEEAEAQAVMQSAAQPAQEPPQRDSDYTLTLAEIVEAQHQIQIRHLEKDSAMAVVAERIMRIAKASGAGVAILEEKTVRYRAGAGASALPVGSEAPLTRAVCSTCLRTGQVLRTPDVNTEFLFDPDLCRSRGIYSLVAVPVYHNGEIVGALELYFDRLDGFVEQDIHTCQLMAGLVTEAIGRDSERSLKKSIAAERSSMLAAIEQLKPSLDSMAERSDEGEKSEAVAQSAATETPIADSATRCGQCASPLVAEEQFCGACGAPRAADTSSVQQKAVAGNVLQEDEPHRSPKRTPSSDEEAISGLVGRLPAGRSEQNGRPEGEREALALQTLAARGEDVGDSGDQDEGPPASNLVKSEVDASAWTSAVRARNFLEGVSGETSRGPLRRFWKARRGDFYLAIAVIAVILVARWGVISSHSPNPPGNGTTGPGQAVRRRPAPDADLSAFDKFLIGLGLAQAPEAPEYRGNPNAQVWVDLHTALYYCNGSDLYGKTANGKYSTQREAQLDQFEPALRKACD